MHTSKTAQTGLIKPRLLIALGLLIVAAYFGYSYFAADKTTSAPTPASSSPASTQSATAPNTDPAEPSADTLSKWKAYFAQLGVDKLEPLPPIHIVDNEDKTDTIRGVDADNNGIRDDIDRLIAEKYADTPQLKKAIEQYARVNLLQLEATTKEEVQKSAELQANALSCIYIAMKQLPPSDTGVSQRAYKWGREVIALLANTPKRFDAYMHSEKIFAGGTVKVINDEDAICDK